MGGGEEGRWEGSKGYVSAGGMALVAFPTQNMPLEMSAVQQTRQPPNLYTLTKAKSSAAGAWRMTPAQSIQEGCTCYLDQNR